MTLHTLTPMLYTDDVDETIAFYTTHLGFTCDGKDEEYEWASMYKDDITIMICKPNEHLEFQGPMFTGSFYIKTTGVDALWQSLKEKVDICYEIDNFAWNMREFAIYDNNGYVIQFGEELALN